VVRVIVRVALLHRAEVGGVVDAWRVAAAREARPCTWRFTHRGDATYHTVGATAITVIARDAAGVIGSLDVPRYLASSIGAHSAPEPP